MDKTIIMVYQSGSDEGPVLFQGKMEKIKQLIDRHKLTNADYCLIEGKIIKGFGQ